MARRYRMKKRAAAQDETRERIVQAAMELHDEKGVASTSIVDVASRAGVGAATVLRHFPTVGNLVSACGQHVVAEMRPPSPDDVRQIYDGIETTSGRLKKLIQELDAFFSRGELRLTAAANDRKRIVELDRFLQMVEAGIEALVREALASEQPGEQLVGVITALCDIAVWRRIQALDIGKAERQSILGDVLEGAVAALRKRVELHGE